MEEASRIASRLHGLDDQEISLVFASPGEIKTLNGEHRGIHEVTDVLSFPQAEGSGDVARAAAILRGGHTAALAGREDAGDAISLRAPALLGDIVIRTERAPALLGDIVICTERAAAQAREYGHSDEREFVYLFVHGLLHLIGFDHEKDEDRAAMREAEEGIMREVGL
jgi:probable rRNA maturation factor